MPALSYIHLPTKATITRCSQPMTGIKQKRSIQDEKLIEAIFQSSDEKLEKLHLIVDARPSVNAIANQAMGAGTESLENYRYCERLFMNIENIHVMRKSLSRNRFVEALKAPDYGIDRLYENIDKSGWFRHLQLLLEASILIVQKVSVEGVSVLVHCSDGWDRTAQLTSISQLILDPHYRTISGFKTLLHKEWTAFGHKFEDRLGHFTAKITRHDAKQEKGKKSKEIAPVFHQFLECTYQIMQQYPKAFEFTDRFLVDLFEACYSMTSYNFACNCEKERLNVKMKSIWDLMELKENYLNGKYLEDKEVLQISTHPHKLKIWNSLYLRFDTN